MAEAPNQQTLGGATGGAGDTENTVSRSRVRSGLGPQGSLTGGSDLIWMAGSTTATVILNKMKAKENADTAWAIGEVLLGGLVAMSLSGSTSKTHKLGTAPTLLNVSLGVTMAGLSYLLTRP